MTPRYLAVPLTLRQCDALQRGIGYLVRLPESEPDHALLVQALGAITNEAKTERDRIAREGGDA